MRIVLDTNILVSALLTPHGATARVLDYTLTGDLTPLVDDRILDEYAEVLARPIFGFAQNQIDDLLFYFETAGEEIHPRPLSHPVPDPHDVMFIEVALSGQADAVVTGNKKHFPRSLLGSIPILNPRKFLDLWHS